MKKNNCFSLLNANLLLALCFLSSCRNSPEVEKGVVDTIEEKVSYTLYDYQLDKETILLQATELAQLLDANSFRSTKRVVSDIMPITNSHFRKTTDSTLIKPIAYVVNFSNDQGYTVLSADARLEPIWILSDDGHLNLNEKISVPTQAMLLQQVEAALNVDYFKSIASTTDKIIPPSGKEPNPIEKFFYSKYGPWEYVEGEKYEKLIPVVWGQSTEPYNSLIREKSKHAGCVTTAVAQIMAFHSYPPYFNWTEMKKHHPIANPFLSNILAYSDISVLYRDLGKYLKVQYGDNGSSAYNEDVPKALAQFGYRYCGILEDFHMDKIKIELEKGYPIYISGHPSSSFKGAFSFAIKANNENFSGHAFVLDGISKFKRLVKVFNNLTGKEDHRYYQIVDMLHANIGWDSPQYNGYYYNGVFAPVKGPILQKMEQANFGEKYVYQYNLKTIGGIRP